MGFIPQPAHCVQLFQNLGHSGVPKHSPQSDSYSNTLCFPLGKGLVFVWDLVFWHPISGAPVGYRGPSQKLTDELWLLLLHRVCTKTCVRDTWCWVCFADLDGSTKSSPARTEPGQHLQGSIVSMLPFSIHMLDLKLFLQNERMSIIKYIFKK